MIRPYKGIENLLQVWQANQTSFQNHTLLIAGKPLDTAYEQKIAALITKSSNTILQANFIPSDLMHLYFSAADVVVLPFTQILTSGSLILPMSYN
jgi:glycosyltransferase involved in cell wall biosynthesis